MLRQKQQPKTEKFKLTSYEEGGGGRMSIGIQTGGIRNRLLPVASTQRFPAINTAAAHRGNRTRRNYARLPLAATQMIEKRGVLTRTRRWPRASDLPVHYRPRPLRLSLLTARPRRCSARAFESTASRSHVSPHRDALSRPTIYRERKSALAPSRQIPPFSGRVPRTARPACRHLPAAARMRYELSTRNRGAKREKYVGPVFRTHLF